MRDNIHNLTQQISKLIGEKKVAKRNMDYYKSNSEQRLYNKSKAAFIDLDIRIVRLINEKAEAEEEFKLQMKAMDKDNETKIDKLIRYINEGSKNIPVNDIKRDTILETLDIITYALQQLDEKE